MSCSADLDDGVCQLSAGHAAGEAGSRVTVRDVCNQLQTKLACVQDALQHLRPDPLMSDHCAASHITSISACTSPSVARIKDIVH